MLTQIPSPFPSLQGADVNAVDSSSGLPVLSMAVVHGHTECLDSLIESGAKVDAQIKSTGNTALHEAVLKGPSRLPCVETLLRYIVACSVYFFLSLLLVIIDDC